MANDVFSDVLKKFTEGQILLAGDFYDNDGFINCGKCNTRKQFEYVLKGQQVKFPIRCECEQKAYEEETRLFKQETHRLAIENLRDSGLTLYKYRKMKFANDDYPNSQISLKSHGYVNNWDYNYKNNKGILMYGEHGRGKTFYSACIANALIDNNIKVLMTDITSLIRRMKGNYGQDEEVILKEILSVPLLILDDLGVERDTSYGYEKLYEILNTRYLSEKPLIISTNFSLDEINNPNDVKYTRLFSRIKENCVPLLVQGENKRINSAIESAKNLKNIFG